MFLFNNQVKWHFTFINHSTPTQKQTNKQTTKNNNNKKHINKRQLYKTHKTKPIKTHNKLQQTKPK